MLQQPQAFAPYVQPDRKRPPKEQAGMVNNPAWSAFYLWKNGEVVEQNTPQAFFSNPQNERTKQFLSQILDR